MTTLHYATCNRLLPFDADANDLDRTNPYYNLRCVIVDFDDQDMGGCDCSVAYLFDSLEHAVKLMGFESEWVKENNHIADYIESLIRDEVDVSTMREYDRRMYDLYHDISVKHHDKYMFFTAEEKCYLVPETKETAQELIKAQQKDCQSIAYHLNANPRDRWANLDHAPYMYEKLGRVFTNCQPLLDK